MFRLHVASTENPQQISPLVAAFGEIIPQTKTPAELFDMAGRVANCVPDHKAYIVADDRSLVWLCTRTDEGKLEYTSWPQVKQDAPGTVRPFACQLEPEITPRSYINGEEYRFTGGFQKEAPNA